jgi:hypothetical protein
MLKHKKLTVSELEQSLSLRAGISKAPRSFRRHIEEYLRTFCEVSVGGARALIPGTESVSAPIFMAIVNPCEQLLGSFRRTNEDRSYWAHRKKPRQAKISRKTASVAFDDEESTVMDEDEDGGDQEYQSLLPILDSARRSPEVKAIIRGRKPGEVLFGFRGMLSPGLGDTWTTDIRFITFNKDWICAIEWRGAFNDPSENATDPIILGFASRRDLCRSIMLLLSALSFEWWCFISGNAKIYTVGKKRPNRSYLKAIEICCRRDASPERMGNDDSEWSVWAKVLPRLSDGELSEVIPRIDLSDLAGSQKRWLREHGVDIDEIEDEESALLSTFPSQVDCPNCKQPKESESVAQLDLFRPPHARRGRKVQ